QEKCFARIREITSSGATVFFVTHSMGTIFDICTRAILFHKGKVLADGLPRRVGYAYEKLLAEERDGQEAAVLTYVNDQQQPEEKQELTKGAQMLGIDVVNEEDVCVTNVWYGREYKIRIRVLCLEDLSSMYVGFRIQKPTGDSIYATSTINNKIDLSGKKGEILEIIFSFPCRLGCGEFLLGCGVGIREEGVAQNELLHYLVEAYQITILGQGPFSGQVDLGLKVTAVNKTLADASHDVSACA
ncbi:MAG: Wzt carbohydrate-binding domain-containing protein, partial [Planctomycetes bacterium]|nr:Wzt carbohydrate-binding domain-containing protein [Planctomycetota bacterium]